MSICIIEAKNHMMISSTTVLVGALKITTISSPGHSPDSASYMVNGDVLFAGDTLRILDGEVHPFYALPAEA